MRDARINLIIEGTSEIMRLFIAREALDPHMRIAGASATSERINWFAAAKFYAKWYPALWLLRPGRQSAVASGRLVRHLNFVERAARRLARDLFHMMVRHRQGLQRRQLVLGRLVDSGAELFAMSAVIARASTPLAPAGAEELADLFCRQARRRLRALHRAIYRNDDRADYKLARRVLDGGFPWLQDNIVSAWRGRGGRE